MLKKLYTKLRKWFNTPPNEKDFFGTSIRKTYQHLVKCNHEYVNKNQFHRECKWCGDYQRMVYYEYGPIRTEWLSDNI